MLLRVPQGAGADSSCLWVRGGDHIGQEGNKKYETALLQEIPPKQTTKLNKPCCKKTSRFTYKMQKQQQ